ncbi:hypothetical protein M2480_001771 [Parabacteroides sp. PFB2-12]|uniref:hypothetical protein n=1 Tax=unclassified Parabacteroides TaxID=2649774 RepID=UPI002476DB44|nr:MULTISPECIES: hypothetical protein [unclassified Parabacteroides]MDH6343145.1 hypothetical protein [Parabacteroides sp. PM6-13]MDH6390789.1 hypothetical protein [Parabacteroides sp. PFB2-12]
METILIDEKEIKNKLVSKIKSKNKELRSLMRQKSIDMGITPDSYLGGLSYAISSEELSLESNINNLLAVYNNNFVESVFFQLDNIKKDRTLGIVLAYLQSRGLESDFSQFKDNMMKEASAKTPIKTKSIEA